MKTEDFAPDPTGDAPKVLIVATIAGTVKQFLMPNIRILQEQGYGVEVAANFKSEINGGTSKKEFRRVFADAGAQCHQIDFTRKATDFRAHARAYSQIKALLRANDYEFAHTNTPIASTLCRMACHATGTRCIYTAHGFHFYDGAPLVNWLLWYPIEKYMSRYTDVLITINHEDYERAKAKFHAKKVVYTPGVGVDTQKFYGEPVTKDEKRKELGLSCDKFVLLSVGELHPRKNQGVVIEALHELGDASIVYLLVGEGPCEDEYRATIAKYALESNVFLLGRRTDVSELCHAADCFIHPSVREGLGIAPLEAMASGLPLICSFANGMKDYVVDGVTGLCPDPCSVTQVASAIRRIREDQGFRERCGVNNVVASRRFDLRGYEEVITQVYAEGGGTS